ncbi:MAG: hypothetical protein NZ922_06160 [Candidatus Methanomethyliaceae archaeon]|nr:hypothetical protein [Candidatus Methanomethyliaceae archaeon]MDW7971489.1 hypothetical protein [Nitrososphaerota archaeon]
MKTSFDESFIKVAVKVLNKFPNLNMIINNVRRINQDFLMKWILKNDFYYVVIKSKFDGSLNGKFFAIMDMASCDELINNVTGKHINILNDYEKSLIQEFFNIFIGTFLANSEEKYIKYEIPEVFILKSHEVLNEVLNENLNIFKIGCEKPIMDIILLLDLNEQNHEFLDNE